MLVQQISEMYDRIVYLMKEACHLAEVTVCLKEISLDIGT